MHAAVGYYNGNTGIIRPRNGIGKTVCFVGRNNEQVDTLVDKTINLKTLHDAVVACGAYAKT